MSTYKRYKEIRNPTYQRFEPKQPEFDKYNHPVDYRFSIDNLAKLLFSELLPYMDSCYFIHAGLAQSMLITKRTPQSVIDQITEAVQMDKKNIVFECMCEGLPFDVVYFVHKVIEQAKSLFPDLKFFFITAAIDGDKVYLDMLSRRDLLPNMEILSFHTFEQRSSQMFNHDVNLPDTYTVINRPKNYVCLNRVKRMHRARLLDWLLRANLVNDKCYYSYHDYQNPDFSKNDDVQFPNITKNSEFVKTLQLNFNPDRVNPVDVRQEDLYLFSDTYFSLVTETLYYDYGPDNSNGIAPCVFLSEKIYKPMKMLHPFVLVARPKSLAILRDRGFKTFHPYINENYDKIVNDNDRMIAIIREVNRLSRQTPEEWLQWCENIKPIVEHNKKRLEEPTSYFVYKDLSRLM